MINTLIILVASSLLIATPYLLAAMGGLTSERAGVMNIALEGKMLLGACFFSVAGIATGNVWIGLFAGIAVSTLASIVHWVLTQKYRADHIISGMAINVFAFGVSSFVVTKMGDSNAKAPSFQSINIELVKNFTWSINPLMIVALVIPFAMAWVFSKTRIGLWIRAVGSDPDKARLMGIRPTMVRLTGLILTGIFTGLAGAILVSATGQFNEKVSAGKGFIGLAALILGGWRPIPSLVAALAFAFFETLQQQFQGQAVMGLTLPPEFWQSLPYLATVIALGGFVRKTRPPAGMGKP